MNREGKTARTSDSVEGKKEGVADQLAANPAKGETKGKKRKSEKLKREVDHDQSTFQGTLFSSGQTGPVKEPRIQPGHPHKT